MDKFLNRKINWIPVFLGLMSIWDLRVEILLLVENFTFIGLFYAIGKHPLSISVLLLLPLMLHKQSR